MAEVTPNQKSIMEFGLQHAGQIAPCLPPPYNIALMAASQIQKAGKAVGVDPLDMVLNQYSQQTQHSATPKTNAQPDPQQKKFNPRPPWAGPDKQT